MTNKRTAPSPIVILFGPTASGKSALALEVAETLNAVIINADSKQLYREIPIITAQPSVEEKARVPHALYGALSVQEDCSVARWIELVRPVIEECWQQGKLPLLVGGTGMYFTCLTQGLPPMPEIPEAIRQQVRQQVIEEGSESVYALLDEAMQQSLKPGDSHRVGRAYEVLLATGKSLRYWQQQPAVPVYPHAQVSSFFLSPPRQWVYERCNRRFEIMMESGVLEEMRALDAMQVPVYLPAMKAHGVPELLSYLHGTVSREDAISKAQQNTRNYIKRQFTWFRGQMPEATALEGADAAEKMLHDLERKL